MLPKDLNHIVLFKMTIGDALSATTDSDGGRYL